MSGWTDMALSPSGVRQARVVAAQLASEGCDAMYTSPLRRTLETSALIAQVVPVCARLEPGLREINCGNADGLSLSEVERRYPEHWTRNLSQQDPDFRWPNGESYRELRDRSLRAVQAIAAAHGGMRVVLVTHAGVISQLLGWIYGESPARWEPYRPRNCSITELEVGSGDLQVVRYDDLSFAPELSEHTRKAG